MFLRIFPSLNEGVLAIDNLRINRFPLLQLPAEVQVNVIEDNVSLCALIESFREELTFSEGAIVIGFDAEWIPQNKISLIQLAVRDQIALIRLAKFRSNGLNPAIPPALKAFLEDGQFVFVGCNIRNDANKLFKDFGTEMKSFRDIREEAFTSGHVDRKSGSLTEAVEMTLKRTLSKSDAVRLSNWEAVELSETQIKYAALDAWACFKVLLKCVNSINLLLRRSQSIVEQL